MSPLTSVTLAFHGETSRIWIYDGPSSGSQWCIYLKVGYPAYDVQLASVYNICTSLAPMLSSVETLEMGGAGPVHWSGNRFFDDYGSIPPEWYHEIEPGLFYAILEPFSGLGTLYIGHGLADPIAYLIRTWGPLGSGHFPRLANLRVGLDGKTFKYDGDKVSRIFRWFVDKRKRTGQEIQLDFS
ncbi:hypothetical protein BC834DRAFT_875634 [Gloeopeniophorella convolvens]|nr:hypothetical protein BC834DRAFT_875634 [Gloeopeniophorella convolvens]